MLGLIVEVGLVLNPSRRIIRELFVLCTVAALAACASEEAAQPVLNIAEPQPVAQAEVESEAPEVERDVPTGPLVPFEVQPTPDIAETDAPPTLRLPRPDGLVRVGFLAPLSGPSAPIGQALANAGQMALFDVATSRYVLQVYDTQGTPDGAAAAAAEAISHGAEVLVGPLFSSSAQAVTPQARAAGVSVLSFSTDVSLAAPDVYVIGFLVHEQVRELVTYARSRGLERFAALIPNTPYGQLVDAAFRQIVFETGATVVDVGYYGTTTEEIEPVVRRIADYDNRRAALLQQRRQLESRTDDVSRRALARLERVDTLGDAPYDALLLPAGGSQLIEVAALLPFYDIDPARVQILGTLLWDQPGLGREPALVGGWYPAPPPKNRVSFWNRYAELYGNVPPSIASHGYDAVALTALLARSEAEAPFIQTMLNSASGFMGIDGIFRLLPSGRAERRFSIMEVTPRGVEEIAPAPDTFQAAQF